MVELDRLRERISQLAKDGLCIAFSGGVDSSLILDIAAENADRAKIIAITCDNGLIAKREIDEAKSAAGKYNIEHIFLNIDVLDNDIISNNPRTRCYHCKKLVFEKMRELALKYGITNILDGTNADDIVSFRPGIKALKELGIISPLAELNITKSKVRQMTRELKLEVSEKPSSPCLATRIPYDTVLSKAVLEKVELGEEFLSRLGLGDIRVRVDSEQAARIEVKRGEFPIVIQNAEKIVDYFKKTGFKFISLDLEGFRSGCYD